MTTFAVYTKFSDGTFVGEFDAATPDEAIALAGCGFSAIAVAMVYDYDGDDCDGDYCDSEKPTHNGRFYA